MLPGGVSAAITVLVLILACSPQAFSRRKQALGAGRIPLFSIRARVTRIGGQTPSGCSFTFKWSVGKAKVKAQGTNWSSWLGFTLPNAKAALRTYSNSVRHRYPLVLRLRVWPVTNPTEVKVQVRFSRTGHTTDLHGDLFGPVLGIMVWQDKSSGKLRVATMASYNQRYWHEFDAAALRPSQRPRHFLIVDRFIGGDNDLLDWQQGISHLAKIGITAMLVPPSAPVHNILLKDGIRRYALAVAMMPGGPLGIGRKTPPLQRWASKFAARYTKAGYSPQDFSLFGIADEPGWYFPGVLRTVDRNRATLEKFRHYLELRHLTPAMLGAASWNEVHPIGHSQLSTHTPLTRRRLFYWSCRFFPWQSAEHMRQTTVQLHRAFSLALQTYTNFNNFNGQFYFQGFRAKNPDFHSPDEAMGEPEWFQLGKVRGTDLMWTEDWFPNNRAYQWSFYAAKFRSIARSDGLGFGGYVIGRVEGKPSDALVQRVLALVGNGAKTVFYYTFGPNYNFPGNCYSNVPGVPAQLAHADRMIAKAESVLWPGHEPQARVAILQPRSSEVWDGLHISTKAAVVGAANTNPNGGTLDYMAEEYDEYLALEMSDVPVDFVDEGELTHSALKNYKVLFITEPDIPAAGQHAIAQWVKNGGTLAMVPGAAKGNRYNEATRILPSLADNPPHQRAYLPNLRSLNQVATIGNTPIFGENPDPSHGGTPLASFDDHSPAISEYNIGRGRVIYYSWFPGIAYAHLALGPHLGLRDSADANSLRKLILKPVQTAEVAPPVEVNMPYVETPILESPEGAAVTLLNWTGHNLQSIKLKVRVPFHIASAISVTHGKIALRRQGNRVTFSLPLGAADIVELRR